MLTKTAVNAALYSAQIWPRCGFLGAVLLTRACGWLNMSGSSSEAIRQKRLHFTLFRCMFAEVVVVPALAAAWLKPILRSSRFWIVRSGQLGRAREAGRFAFPSVSDPRGTAPDEKLAPRARTRVEERERERLCVCLSSGSL